MKVNCMKEFMAITNIFQIIINHNFLESTYKHFMSRNNVFKLSGNMALGSSDPYTNSDIGEIKSSLKLLKAKQQKKEDYTPPPQNYGYPGSYSNGGPYSSNLPQRNDRNSKNGNQRDYDEYNYEQSAKNHMPTYKEPSNSNYKDANYGDNGAYGNKQPNYGGSNGNINSRLPPKRKNQDYDEPVYEKPQPRQRNQQGSSRDVYQPPQQEYNPPPQQRGNQRQPNNNTNNRNSQQQQYQPQQQPLGPEKSIKQINKENRVDIIEYDPSELKECRAGCGRKFNPDSIIKHQKICKKVFQKKRKQFNTQKQRIISQQQPKLMKKGQLVEKKIQKMKANEKIPKWKAESLQLRAGLKATKNEAYQPTREQQAMLDQSKSQNQLKCPTCGRTFNLEAGKRHIAFCQQQSKKNVMKRK